MALMPRLADAARARGIELKLMAEAPDAPVRMVQWSAIDGCVATLLARIRSSWGAARALLLVEGDAAAVAAGLDAGADDAARADANPIEIVARLASLLRTSGDKALTIGDLSIDRMTQAVERGGRPIALLPREYAVLLHLAEHAGVAVPRSALLRSVWRCGFDPGTNVVQVQVSRLRAKLHAAGGPMLHTDRGQGYRLGDPASHVGGADRISPIVDVAAAVRDR